MQPHFQTTPFTTASAALLTVLNKIKSIELTQENEFKIWHNSANLPTRGSSIFALANIAHKNGIPTKVVTEKTEFDFPDYRFYRYTKEDIENAIKTEKIYEQKARKNNVQIQQKSFSFNDIKQEIKKNNLLLLRLNVKPIRQSKRNTSNYLLIHGYSNGYFHIFDPGFAGISMPESTVKEAFTSLGTKKYRSKRMIIFENV